MDEDKFSLNKSNKIMIIITSVSLVILGISIIFLTNSYSKPIKELPDLATTEGRTSTKYAKETTTETTTSSSTTTKAPDMSPYYKVDTSVYFDSELLTKNNLSKDEKNKLIKQFYDFFSSLYTFYDMSIFKTDIVLNNVKSNENDVITVDGHKYAEIYDGMNIMEKYLSPNITNSIKGISYNGVQIFMIENKKLYRVEPLEVKGKTVLTDLSIVSATQSDIVAEIQYYMSDYKENGLSAPVYKKSKISIEYVDKKWTMNMFKCPLFE